MGRGLIAPSRPQPVFGCPLIAALMTARAPVLPVAFLLKAGAGPAEERSVRDFVARPDRPRRAHTRAHLPTSAP